MSHRLRSAVAVAALAAASGCKQSRESTPASAQAEAPAAPPTADPGLPWIYDDYATALARARERDLPLVIDLWAEWCHTCLSMKHEVFPDPGLATLASQFVWLSIDTDKPTNAAVLRKFPPAVWPTFFVVAPDDETIQARYLGAASVAQLRGFLREGARAVTDARAADGTLAADDPAALARAGDRAAVAGDHAAAALAYAETLAKANADWPRRPDLLVSLASSRFKAGEHGACAQLGLDAADQTGRAASAADFLYWTTRCAAELPDDDARATRLRDAAIERLRALAADGEAPLSVDDRSEALRILRELLIDAGDEPGARAVAHGQRALLDRAAAAATTPYAASTYNWPRAEVYVFLGAGEQLLADLRASAAALPDQYDPPYREGWLLHQLGREDEAVAATERALALAYGPRKARVYQLLADIHEARGDAAARRDALAGLVELYAGLPQGQRQPDDELAAREALAATN